MSTVAHTVTRWVADQWEQLYPSAVCSGIAPDRAHLARGGYHVSIEDNKPDNYSVTRPDDKAGPRGVSAAIDMSMSPADMVRCTARLRRVYNDPDDPRRAFLNAFNGWVGRGDAQRFDIWRRVISYATDDHKWHIHLEWRRRHVPSWTAARAVVSALVGESATAYEASLRPVKDVDDMTPDELLNTRIPFSYTDTDGNEVKTYLTLGSAAVRGWTHDYEMRNKTLPALTAAVRELTAQITTLNTQLAKLPRA